MVHAVRSPSVTKSLVGKILENPVDYDWSIQGLGMLRLYLDDHRRLHIWDDRFQVENVSQMHTHPWDFRSLVVAGQVTNILFIETNSAFSNEEYYRQMIFCGEGGGLVGERDKVFLKMRNPEVYVEGQSYYELANEIHISQPERGTVTIIKRDYLDDVDHAYVYWKDGDWVSAEPRKATDTEILSITQNALETWW